MLKAFVFVLSCAGYPAPISALFKCGNQLRISKALASQATRHQYEQDNAVRILAILI